MEADAVQNQRVIQVTRSWAERSLSEVLRSVLRMLLQERMKKEEKEEEQEGRRRGATTAEGSGIGNLVT